MNRSGILFCLIFALCFISIKCDVVVLTKDNFEEHIKGNDHLLVKFYAPWCGHCKDLAPHFKKAAEVLKEQKINAVLADVDAVVETDLADKYEIRGYPTLKFFRKGVPEEYGGGRSTESIVDWVKKMTGPSVQVVENYKEAIEKNKIEIAFVGEFKDENSELYRMYFKVAEENKSKSMAFFSVLGAATERIFAYRTDDGEFQFDGKDAIELKSFVQLESFPFFGPVNAENFPDYNARPQEMVWLCSEEGSYKDYKEVLRTVAKEYHSTLSFVWLNIDEFRGYAETALGVSEFPTMLYQSKKGRFILPDIKKSMEAATTLQKFFEDVKAGKIDRTLKSEPIPEKNDAAVKIVVAKSFNDMVLNGDKDVMLEIYAPWCSACKKFQPVYDEFAEKMKDVAHLVIAKMDGTANEAASEEFNWTAFPTVFFIKAGETIPLRFDGDRTLEGMMSYVKKHSTKPIEKPDKWEEL